MFKLLVTLLLIPGGTCLNNGVGLTPQQGWNSWNHFACNINETVIRETIDAFIEYNLAEYGYKYVSLDDCWMAQNRTSDGKLTPDPTKFPNGLEPLISYAHSNGLLFGLYEDSGNFTCQGRAGSLGYETVDANTFAQWQVDYLKFDGLSRKRT